MPIPANAFSAFALLIAAIAGSGLGSCTLDPATRARAVMSEEQRRSGVLDPTDADGFNRMLDDVGQRRIIYLGELHDHYDHHVNQLQVIRGLHEKGRDIALGFEAFQAPFQRHLDDYASGRIDENQMLRRTEYYDRWRFDHRLYREILRFAREEGIPLLALSAPSEIVEAVSGKGIAGLDNAQRSQLPPRIAPADAAYRKRLRDAFAMHGDLPEARLKRFMEVQSIWDEYMARRGAEYLAKHPEKTLVLLVGSAHVLHESGIPRRLSGYFPATDSVIVTSPFQPVPGMEPDYILAARDTELSPRGRTGMTLRGDRGQVTVIAVSAASAAKKAGIKTGDRILKIADEPIAGLTDVRLALTDGSPGDRLTLEIERSDAGAGTTRTRVLLTLF